MKKQLLTILLALLATFASAQKNGTYKTILNKVEVQGKLTADSSNITVDSSSLTNGRRYVYTDSLIEISWFSSISQMNFELKNISRETIKLIWDEASYIDTRGSANKVFHNGVKFIERNNTQPSTTIIKNSKLSDLIAPSDNVYYTTGKYGGWNQHPLFITSRKIEAPLFHNKSVRVLLPLAVGGTIREYVFTFDVKWVEDVKTKKK